MACTITPHHLALTVDSWAGQPLNFCKPVAKLASDREALRRVIAEGNPKFFLGSDSAPHSLQKKMPSAHDFVHARLSANAYSPSGGECPSCAAGIYSSSELMPLLAEIFEDESLGMSIPLEHLEGFTSTFGRAFYGEAVASSEESLVMQRRVGPRRRIVAGYSYTADDGQQEYLRPFYADKEISWEIVRC